MVENFQETPAVGDGLAIMVEAYRRLGLDDLASTSLETLKLNYPCLLYTSFFGQRQAGATNPQPDPWRTDRHQFWLAVLELGIRGRCV